MLVIYKYHLAVSGEQQLDTAAVKRWLGVQLQFGLPMVWAVVDPDGPSETHTIHSRGTGVRFESDVGEYIGTYHITDGNLVLHVFVAA